MAGTLTDRLNNAYFGGAAIKSPCRVGSTGNLTLSGYQTVDGIAVGASDATADLNMRILVKNQTNSSANGIYVISNSAWSRARDFDGARDVLNGTLVWVSTGASQGGGFYNVTNADPVTPDTSTAITFTAADVIVATAAASSAAAFAACAYVAAGSAYVAAGSAYVAAGSASVAAGSAYVAAGSAYAAAGSAFVALSCANTAAGSAIVAAGSAYVAANSAYVAAGSAYVAAGSAITNAASAATAAGSAIVAASSAYVAASCAYVAAGCAYVAAGCAAGGGTIVTGSTGQIVFYSSATTPGVRGASEFTYDSAGGMTLGASGVTAGSLVLASTGGGNTTVRGSTVAVAYTLAFPSSLGSTGQVVQLNTTGGLLGFATAASGGFTLGTPQATTSGTSFNFGSIPAGTKQIIVSFQGVSNSSTDHILVQLGDSGGIETTGYTAHSFKSAAAASYPSTVGFIIAVADAALVVDGIMVLTLLNSATFLWASGHSVAATAGNSSVGGGSKALSAELTQITITGSGNDAFDAGSVNIMYIG